MKKISQTRIERILSTISGGLFGAYLKPGFPFFYIGDDALDFLGYQSEDQFILENGNLTINTIHPDDRKGMTDSIMAQLALGSRYIVEYRMRKRDGTYIWVHDVGDQGSDDTGAPVIISVCYDITASKKAQLRLNETIQNVACGICIAQLTPDFSYVVEDINQGFCALFEDTKDNLVAAFNANLYHNVHPDDVHLLKEMYNKLKAHHRQVAATFRIITPSGTLRWLKGQVHAIPQEDGSFTVYITYFDLTAQMKQQEAFKASELSLNIATEQGGLWCFRYNPNLDQIHLTQKCMVDFNLPAVIDDFPKSIVDRGLILPEYVDLFCQMVKAVKDGQRQVKFEAQMRLSDGDNHWGRFCFTRLEDPTGNPGMVICTTQLADEEKAMEVKYELERQKPSMGDENLLLHACFNLITGKTVEYGTAKSDVPLKAHYPTMASAVSHATQAMVDPKEIDALNHMNSTAYLLSQLRSGITSFSMDYRRKMEEGPIIWVRNIFHLTMEPNTRELLLFEYCYNIHQQKMAEEIIETVSSVDYVILASLYLDVNKMYFYEAYGDIAPGTLVDYTTVRHEYAQAFIDPLEHHTFYAQSDPPLIIKMVDRGKAYSFITKITDATGKRGIIKTRFLPYDPANKVYIMTVTDITDLLEQEEAKNQRLLEALSVAKQASTAKTDFLSSMSHDIRTPMNAIVGMCELALDDENNPEQVHDSLMTIRSSSQLLLSLINNILDMSRIESGKMTFNNEPFVMSTEIEATASNFRALALAKNQRFFLTTHIVHHHLTGDIARIHSAIDNILSNAVKYTPPGGTITYEVEEITGKTPGISLYRFKISDTGIGMSPEQQKYIFEPFYRGKSEDTKKIEGTGLGLSITKAIVDLKGGTISLDSAPGCGSTFVVELPLHYTDEDHAPAAKAATPEAKKQYNLSGLHILICEDHPVNQKVATKMLTKVGAAVTVACDGQMGYEAMLHSVPGTYDLILMDIQMPKMNGHEATLAIRQSDHPQAATIPIIAMTANAFSEDVAKSLKVGMNEHLAKPIVPSQLYESILGFVHEKKSTPPPKPMVLIVDDVDINLAQLTAAIDDDYQVFGAKNGQEALEILAKHPQIAAVITDIIMPEMDGIALIKAIRDNPLHRQVAIVANTQYGDAQQAELLLEIGADDFLYKPTTPILVKKRLEVVLHQLK